MSSFERKSKLGTSFVVGMALLGGCAEQKPQGAAVRSPHTDGAGEIPPEPPLHPAPAPDELVFVGRAREPARAIDIVSKWVNSPLDWRRLLDGEAKELLHMLDERAPIDVAVALAPDSEKEVPLWAAFSIPVRDRDVAKDTLRKLDFTVNRLGAYAYRVLEPTPCVIVSALGVAKARLICGDSQESVDALAPYLARGLPTEDLGEAHVFAELRLGPIQERYGHHASAIKLGVPFVLQEARTGDSRLDGAFAEAVRGLADEAVAWTEDASDAKLQGWLREADQRFELRLETKLRGKKSWLGENLALSVATQAPAPDTFWELPKDSTDASYSVAGDPQRMEELTRVTSEIVEAALEHVGVKRARSIAFGDAFRGVLAVPGPVVFASGAVPAGALTPGTIQATVQSVREAVGYNLIGISGDKGRFLRALEEGLDLYVSPAIRGYAKKNDAELDLLPEVKKKRAPGGKGLAPGAVEFTITLTRKALLEMVEAGESGDDEAAKAKRTKEAKTSPLPQAYLVVMPVGDVTWFGVSLDEADLFRRMADLTRPGEPTLSERPGLESFKTVPAVSASFGSIATYSNRGGAFLEAMGSTFDSGFDGAGFRAVARESLPNHGMNPILSRVTTGSDGPRLRYDMVIEKGTFDDLAVLFATFAASMMKAKDATASEPDRAVE